MSNMTQATNLTVGAKAALAAFQSAKGTSGEGRFDIRDLITELLHLHGEPVDELLAGAREVYDEECEQLDDVFDERPSDVGLSLTREAVKRLKERGIEVGSTDVLAITREK